MFRSLALLILLLLFACTGGEPAGQRESTVNEPAAEGAAGVPPDQQMINCLNHFREKRYDEALPICRQALASNPGDPQIMKAIELSEQALKGGGA